MQVFESAITEFVGLATHAAQVYYHAPELPLGVLEKMLSVAKHLMRVDLPNMDTVITQRGSQNLIIPEGLVAYQEPLYLRNLKSGYFQQERRGQNTFIKPGKRFQTHGEWASLTGKPYFPQIESATRALVEIWNSVKFEGLMLVDMCRKNDGGLTFLTADLEIAILRVRWFLAEPEGLRSQPRDYRGEFENALDAFRDKHKILVKARELLEKASGECPGLAAQSLLASVIPLPSDSIFMKMLDELYKVVCEGGRAIFDAAPNAMTGLTNAVQRMSCMSQEQKFTERGTPEAFLTRIYYWLLALSGVSKPDLYTKNAFAVVGGDRPVVAACDLRDFTSKLNTAESRGGTIGKPEICEWFSRVRAVVRNWWLAFGGTLSRTGVEEGDSFFACFQTVGQAVVASAWAVSHLDLLDKCVRGAPVDLGHAALIGVQKRTDTRVIDGVDVSSAANELFHQIKDVKDRDQWLRDRGSALFIPQSLLHECAGLEACLKTRLPNGLSLLNSLEAAGMVFSHRDEPTATDSV